MGFLKKAINNLVQRPVVSPPPPPPPLKPVVAAPPQPAVANRAYFSDGMMSDQRSQLRARVHLLGGMPLPPPASMNATSGVSFRGPPLQEDLGPIIIGPTIGRAGTGAIPTRGDQYPDPLTGTITASEVNLRAGPNRSEPSVLKLDAGTTVTVVEPQPDQGQDDWLYVSVEGEDGEKVYGWVANGWNGNDFVDLPAPADPGGRIQNRMEGMGYLPPGGALDEMVIADFQMMNGLPSTGVLDDATLAAMWSPDARISTHITQVQDDVWNHSEGAPSSSVNCGPTSVSVALAAAGVRGNFNLFPQMTINISRELSGTEPNTRTGPGALETAVIARGGEAYRLKNLEDVQAAITGGDPVILFGHRPDGEAHWVTVIGYDPGTDSFIVSDPLSHQGVQRWDRDAMNNYADFSTYDGVTYDAIAVSSQND